MSYPFSNSIFWAIGLRYIGYETLYSTSSQIEHRQRLDQLQWSSGSLPVFPHLSWKVKKRSEHNMGRFLLKHEHILRSLSAVFFLKLCRPSFITLVSNSPSLLITWATTGEMVQILKEDNLEKWKLCLLWRRGMLKGGRWWRWRAKQQKVWSGDCRPPVVFSF